MKTLTASIFAATLLIGSAALAGSVGISAGAHVGDATAGVGVHAGDDGIGTGAHVGPVGVGIGLHAHSRWHHRRCTSWEWRNDHQDRVCTHWHRW